RQEPSRHLRADSTGALRRLVPMLRKRADAPGESPLCEGGSRMRRGLTSDARRALTRAGFSRRSFLKGSGAVIVTFASAGVMDQMSGVLAQGFNGTSSPQLDSW